MDATGDGWQILQSLFAIGSGGFLGYWGWFAEKGLGRYFAYYGRKSDCFLVTLKDGRKYVLGCREASDLVGALGARLAARS